MTIKRFMMVGFASVLLSGGLALADDPPTVKAPQGGCGGCCEGEGAKAKDGCGDCGDCGDCMMASNPLLETIKSLQGDWTTEDGIKVNYKVTSAGTAVIETLMPGTPKEMVTVYHLDGDTLALTHFCAMGNQPRLKLVKSEGKTLRFEFVDGDNCDPSKGFMGRLVMTIDGGHLRHEWTVLKDGKDAQTVVMDFTRGQPSGKK